MHLLVLLVRNRYDDLLVECVAGQEQGVRSSRMSNKNPLRVRMSIPITARTPSIGDVPFSGFYCRRFFRDAPDRPSCCPLGSMYAEVSTMHMLGICNEWAKDETAQSLWTEEDKTSVYNWCREVRGRLPNLEKKTSGGGQVYKLVQALPMPIAPRMAVCPGSYFHPRLADPGQLKPAGPAEAAVVRLGAAAPEAGPPRVDRTARGARGRARDRGAEAGARGRGGRVPQRLGCQISNGISSICCSPGAAAEGWHVPSPLSAAHRQGVEQ
jgi:hypothetical protein